MILKFKLLDKYLNLLLVFLFPTQLAIHFWPAFSFIFGIRIDYLSPTIYFTDILFISLLIPWVIRKQKVVFSQINKNKFFILILLIIAALNIFISISPLVSLIRWVKIIEFIVLALYVKERQEIFNVNNVAKTLFYSLCFFSAIGILQFIRGRTFDNYFYLLGERSFSVFTPGISLVNLFGEVYLRIYSTFPHPNSLAGYVAISFIFIILSKFNTRKVVKFIGYILISLVFFLTFSLSSFIGLLVCLLIYILLKNHFMNIKSFNILFIMLIILSFYFAIFSKPILNTNVNIPQSFEERLVLGNISEKMFLNKWLLGTGLGTFIIKEASFAGYTNGVWLLQPVHNVYLLILSEVGVAGILLLYLLFRNAFKNIVSNRNLWGYLIIIFLLVSALFDHYWFTIQQNTTLLSLLLGISFRKEN